MIFNKANKSLTIAGAFLAGGGLGLACMGAGL